MKTKTTQYIKIYAAILLGLWFVILFGFFAAPLMAHHCAVGGADCSSEFMHEVESMESTPLLIQFGFFFFVAAVCEICLPKGISCAVLEPEFSPIMNVLKVLSPPPRFSRI